jgi:hypothetical protein
MARARDEEADVREDIVVSGDPSGDLDLLEIPLEDAPVEDSTPEPVGHRRRLRWYVLGAAGAMVIVLAAVLVPIWWQLFTQRDASLATPDHLAGLTLDRSADGQATAEYLRTAVAASVSLDTSVGAVYDDPADKKRTVMFFGGTGLLLSPDRELSAVFRLLEDQGGGMKDVRPVPAGAMGGEMKCGTSTGDGGDMSVCGWADHGSIALALFPGRSLDEAAVLLRQMRDGIQHRS